MKSAHLYTIGHEVDIRPRWIVSLSIGKHQLHIIMELLRLLVSCPIDLGLDRGKVHGLGDDDGVVFEDGRVYRLGERKSPLQHVHTGLR